MRNGWNWKYPLSNMYPAHTQLVVKCSSPSIGDQRATGCAVMWAYIELIKSYEPKVLNAMYSMFLQKQFFMPVSKFGFFYFYLVRCEDTSWWYKQRCWWSADTIWQLDNVHNVWTQLDLNKWLKTAKASEASLATSLPPGTVTRNLLRICSTACCQLGNKKSSF